MASPFDRPLAAVNEVGLGVGLSPPAFEVLGTLAACTWNGPHRAKPLRRWTRLTQAAFDDALGELARTGLVELDGAEFFWVTDAGEDWTRRLFR